MVNFIIFKHIFMRLNHFTIHFIKFVKTMDKNILFFFCLINIFLKNAYSVGPTLNADPIHHHQPMQNTNSYTNNNYGIISNNSIASNTYHLQIPQQQQQQGFINRAKSPTNRSKSPPSMHSPPMSPVSRMPLSPKSPRQRQSNVLMNINLNNSNTNTNITNNSSLNPSGFQKIANLPLQVCTIVFKLKNSSTLIQIVYFTLSFFIFGF